jgi:diguanylate cyclase (GGDEF)-like protein/PAS domain S-box-containing protein
LGEFKRGWPSMKFEEVVRGSRLSREVVLEMQLDGIIINSSSNCFTILGYKKEEMMGHKITEFMNEEIDLNLIVGGLNEESLEIVIKDKSGNLMYMNVNVNASLNQSKRISSLYLCMHDITKYKNIEQKTKRLIKIIEGSNYIICSLQILPHIKLNYISPAITKNLGYSVEEIEEDPMLLVKIAHPDEYEFHISKGKGNIDYYKDYEKRYKHKNGKYIWFEEYSIPIYDEEGKLIGLEGVIRNIQERKKLEKKLERFSYYDSLTGIYNKRYFHREIERLNNDIDVKLGIIICDLDNLKYVNDTFGHAEGDIVLKQTALLLSKAINENMLIARIGGDEFAILIKDLNEEEFKDIYNKTQESILDYNKDNSRIPIQISMGIAYNESSIGFTEELFRTADKNMYLNKRNKKKYRKLI